MPLPLPWRPRLSLPRSVPRSVETFRRSRPGRAKEFVEPGRCEATAPTAFLLRSVMSRTLRIGVAGRPTAPSLDVCGVDHSVMPGPRKVGEGTTRPLWVSVRRPISVPPKSTCACAWPSRHRDRSGHRRPDRHIAEKRARHRIHGVCLRTIARDAYTLQPLGARNIPRQFESRKAKPCASHCMLSYAWSSSILSPPPSGGA